VRGVSLLGGLAAACAALSLAAAGGAHGVKEGGTFRIGLSGIFDYIDPALAYHGNSWMLLDTSCATLMRYPDKAPPAGYTLVTEVAAAPPRASKDLKTWTFTLRRTFRFSDGTPVQASAFARAIHRTLDPAIESPAALYTETIVGAKEVLAGKATEARGVVARGYTLTVRFTKPVPDFPAQTTMMFFCAVPPGLPVDPEGIGTFAGSGPYFVSEFRPGERLIIERNPYYRGTRPHRVDGFLVDLRPSTADQTLDDVERGDLDWGYAGRNAPFDAARGLVRKYGVNKSRFFLASSFNFSGFALNVTRPLFRDNVPLRQAVNLAVNRAAQVSAGTGTLTDQYLPNGMPGFRDARIYPLRGPDLKRARALARGHMRSGRANLYVPDVPSIVVTARTLKRDLAKIGLDVRIVAVPTTRFGTTIGRRGEPVDIVRTGVAPDYIDPAGILVPLFDGRFAGTSNYSWMDDPEINRALRTAATLQGAARYRAFGELDVKIAREEAPIIGVSYTNEPTLVSARTGCVIVRPMLDLTAVCLK
jgi:ABC-type oligopeptide transport system substrate-binding subunit